MIQNHCTSFFRKNIIRLFLITLLFFIHTVFSTSHIYAPWRQTTGTSQGCCFCNEIKANKDEQNLILKRTGKLIIQLNPYPYTRCSILIYPVVHIDNPHIVPVIVWADMFLLAEHVMWLLRIHYKLESYSIGMNIGPLASGSKPGHLHLHIIPRYPKESNGFLETTCDVRLIQYDLKKLYTELKKIFI